MLLELQTAKKVIELLHEDTNTFTNLESGNTSSILSDIHSDFKKHLRTSGIQSITLDENTSSKLSIFFLLITVAVLFYGL